MINSRDALATARGLKATQSFSNITQLRSLSKSHKNIQ